MFICIRSEIDSRPLLYPLIRSLWNFGLILVITSNKQLERLIDDEEVNGFRNTTIVVDTDGATDDILNDYGFAPDDYDFTIVDNMGISECDVLFIAVGGKQSESFEEDINTLLEKREKGKAFLVQFGKSNAPKSKSQKENKSRVAKSTVIDKDYDPSDKFTQMAENVKTSVKTVTTAKVGWPSFEDIERVESEHRFYDVPQPLVSLFHSVFGETLGVNLMVYRKEMRIKDENSSSNKTKNNRRK